MPEQQVSAIVYANYVSAPCEAGTIVWLHHSRPASDVRGSPPSKATRSPGHSPRTLAKATCRVLVRTITDPPQGWVDSTREIDEVKFEYVTSHGVPTEADARRTECRERTGATPVPRPKGTEPEGSRNRRGRGKQEVGGAEGIRTLDPHVANVVLSQLSYCPTQGAGSLSRNHRIGQGGGAIPPRSWGRAIGARQTSLR